MANPETRTSKFKLRNYATQIRPWEQKMDAIERIELPILERTIKQQIKQW